MYSMNIILAAILNIPMVKQITLAIVIESVYTEK